jgi:hypothetical protein
MLFCTQYGAGLQKQMEGTTLFLRSQELTGLKGGGSRLKKKVRCFDLCKTVCHHTSIIGEPDFC